ncbi:MAG: hypothetical protein V7L10_07175 [Nostoc sp.]|uniref:hypothetical protein n=1 Tax=Nostoc sp. TaxID=1180 RepID=UPI002FF4BDDD
MHTEAIVAYKRATIRLTHSYIIAEYVALGTARRFPRSSVLAFVVDLLDNPDIETVWVDESLHRTAVDLLMGREDKTYSLCDDVEFCANASARDYRSIVYRSAFRARRVYPLTATSRLTRQ